MSGTHYAEILVYGEINDGKSRVEKLYVNDNKREEVRFSRWTEEGQFIPHPLVLPETDLRRLLANALEAGVFSDEFRSELKVVTVVHNQTQDLRDTKQAKELARGVAHGGRYRIERLFIKKEKNEQIRFSWWKDARFIPRPLDLPEPALVTLFANALGSGVFDTGFEAWLKAML